MNKIIIIILLFFIGHFQVLANENCVNDILSSSNKTNVTLSKNKISKASQAFLFFDTSINMGGFINPPSSAYKLFVSELIKKTPLISKNQIFHTYISTPEPLSVNKIGGITTKHKFYECKGDVPQNQCHTRKAKFSKILNFLNIAPKDSLTIIVSDLFWEVNELAGDNRDKVEKPFVNALKKGEAIGIFGIQSLYEGKIFGICGTSAPYENAASRPFFVILVGNKDVILEFKHIMDEDIFSTIGIDKVEFNIFTNDIISTPYYAANWPSTTFDLSEGISKQNVLNEDRQDLIEFGVNREHEPLNISFDLNKVQTPHTILVSDFYTKTLTHQKRRDSGSCDKQWIKINERENIVFFKNQDLNNLDFDMFNTKRPDSLQFQRNKEYLFQIDFIARKIGKVIKYCQHSDQSSPNYNKIYDTDKGCSKDKEISKEDYIIIAEKTPERRLPSQVEKFWMQKDKWSFSCERSQAIMDAERPLFPVLNLDTFGALLIDIQETNFKETSVSQMNIAVRLNK